MIGKYFGIIAILFLILGFTMPENFKWVLSKVGGISVLTFLLGIVMFGMGTTLSVKDFVLVFKRPRDVFLGAVAQFSSCRSWPFPWPPFSSWTRP